MSYIDGLDQDNYVPNVIIFFAGKYFSIRQPDSGLSIEAAYEGLVSRVAVNPTSIDPLRASTTFSSNSFTLLDRNQAVSSLFLNSPGFRVGEDVRIWLGRSNEALDFSDYLELPRSSIKSFKKTGNNYNFSTIEQKDRLNNGAFNKKDKLAVAILASTTVVTLQAIPSGLPVTGHGKIGNEFIGWVAISGNNLIGVTRGEFGSTPEAHASGTDFFNVVDISLRNGIDFLAQMLISSGGGGSYDVLSDGASFDESLVDLAQFAEVKAAFYSSFNLSFRLYGIDSLQAFLENEVLAPLGVRLRTNNNAKIGLALINRNIFDTDSPLIDEDVTNSEVGFSVSDDRVFNRVRIFWDWSDASNLYSEKYEAEDAASIALFGAKPYYELKFKGVRSLGDVESIAELFLARFNTARPDITVDAFNKTTALVVGDKSDLYSSTLPTIDGGLGLYSSLEVLKKSYNPETGIVKYQLAFTSFSGIRQCFIAPSDTVISWTDFKTAVISTGRGAYYREGWKMMLYDNSTNDHLITQVNTIASISGDTITFAENWNLYLLTEDDEIILTEDGLPIYAELSPDIYRIKFADYDDVITQQKKFCFISDGENNFNDGLKPYQVTIS